MTERLPSDRTFLLRLSGGVEPSEDVNRGRIEHIQSGKVARFSSFENVRQFMFEVLAEQQMEAGSQETSLPNLRPPNENDVE